MMRASRAKLALLAVLALVGCRKPAEGPPDGAEAGPATPTFVAGPFKPLEVPELGLRLEAPANLEWKILGRGLQLWADGFPGAAIGIVHTESVSAVGGGGRCDERLCRYVYAAPCRELTCEVVDPGEHVSFIPALCGSVRSTYEPPTAPTVRALSTGGTNANCDDKQLETTQALDGPIAQLLPEIDACWRARADDDPAWHTGEVNVRLERTIGEGLERSYRLFAGLSGLEGDTTKLQECLDGAIAALRGRLPAIVDADCVFAWDHRFLLGREPSCPPPGAPIVAPGDGGTAPDDEAAAPTASRTARADGGTAPDDEGADAADGGTTADDDDATADDDNAAANDGGAAPSGTAATEPGADAPASDAGTVPEGDTP